jgi:RND family efflux transporter, MFP subunit
MSELSTLKEAKLANKPTARSWIVKLGAIAVLVVGIGAAFSFLLSSRRPTESREGTVEQVVEQTITLRIRASGSVVPIQSVNISPKQAGRLVELLVEQGDRIAQGQILARMDDSSVLPQVLQARASVAAASANLDRLRNGSRTEEILSARARLESAKARLELAEAKYQRNRLLAEEGAISRDRLDEFAIERRTAQATVRDAQQQLAQLERGSRPEDIAQAEAQLLQAEANLRAVEVQLEDTIIRSPISGIVAQKYATAGSFVAPQVTASATNSATSASIVAIASGLEILARVPEVDISQIHLGQEVEITADAFPTKTYKGQVRLIAPEAVIEQNVTSFQVRIKLLTGQDELRSGMNTDLRFLGDTLNNVLTVPTVAIVTQDGKTGVLVANAENQPEFRAITLGTAVDDRTQVLSGLQAGDRIFVARPR